MGTERGQVAGKPIVKWNGGGKRPPEPATPWSVAKRLGKLVFVVANPLLTVSALGLAFAFARTKARGWWLVVAGAVATVVTVGLHGGRAYTLPWRELGKAVSRGFDTKAGSSGPSANAVMSSIGDTISARWQHWAWVQLPFSLSMGLLLAGGVLAWRQRYRADWRGPQAERQSEKAITKAMKALEVPPKELVPAAGVADLDVVLGVDEFTAKPFLVAARALAYHCLILGPSGYGKSTSLRNLIWGLCGAPQAEKLRAPVVLVDMKGDPEMVAYLRGLAHKTGRRFHLVTEDGLTGTTYNPLRRGTADQIKDRLIECEANAADGGFSEPHYRRAAERFILLVCAVLVDLVDQGRTVREGKVTRPWRRDLPDLVRLMEIEFLGKQVDVLSPELATRVRTYLDRVTANKDRLKSIDGIYDRFALIAEGDAGRVLIDRPEGLDLYQAIKAGDVVLFSLDAMASAATGRQIGNLALQDLNGVFSRMLKDGYKDAGNLALVALDEFSALGGSILLAFFARARGAGAAVVLATQTRADLLAVSDQFADAVETNTNVKVLHQQRGEAASAQAEAIGTYEALEETTQVQEDTDAFGSTTTGSGVGSLRTVDKFRIHPNELRELLPGVAVVLIGQPVRMHGRVRVRAVPMPADPGADWTGATPPPAHGPVATSSGDPEDVDSLGVLDVDQDDDTDPDDEEDTPSTSSGGSTALGATVRAKPRAKAPKKATTPAAPETSRKPVHVESDEDDDDDWFRRPVTDELEA